MINQTNPWGRRLEVLYEACMQRPIAERAGFIAHVAGDDKELAVQLRMLMRLEDPVGANPLSTSGSADVGGFEFAPNTEFGKFRIVSGHGAGAMGAVYLALDLENHNRRVALKVMQPTLLGENDRLRFTDETAALSRLVHPNIAQLRFRGIQRWQDADRPYLVMEYVEGQTLDSYIAAQCPTRRQILELLRKISLAVHYGHLVGVFHRDLKPSNILVTPEGEPKIVDFGVSFMVSTGTAPGQQTQLNENVGTPEYMAPEVADARPYSPDPRTDVYSLGVIAFECFAGRRPDVVMPSGEIEPLGHGLRKSIRQRIATCERERLRSVSRDFGTDLDSVVAMALRLEMERRYSNAGELAADFERLLKLEPVSARPATKLYVASMFVRRNRLSVTAGFVTVMAIIGVAVGLGIANIRVKAQVAAGHFLTAGLAEQRGDWKLAVQQYKAADAGGYGGDAARRLALSVGELRALSRDGQTSEVAALIERVKRETPAVAASPSFQVVVGLTDWTSAPDKSVQEIRQSLAHPDQLSPADRAFAEALTTDDIQLVQPKLQESLKYDLFNRDAWAALALCDLMLGQARECKLDAEALQRLYPQDQCAAVLGAVGAAFDRRPEAVDTHLAACGRLSSDMKQSLSASLHFICGLETFEDYLFSNEITPLNNFLSTVVEASEKSEGRSFPLPVTLSRMTQSLDAANEMVASANADNTWEVISRWPNGDGEFAIGWLAFKRNDFSSAIQHFKAVQSVPSLIDCRRLATISMMFARSRQQAGRHTPINANDISLMKPDADRLIELGGFRADKFDPESHVINVVLDYKLYWQARTLALLWLSHSADDPVAIFYLALADYNLNDHEMASTLLKRAIVNHLPADLLGRANELLSELQRSPSTAPTTRLAG